MPEDQVTQPPQVPPSQEDDAVGLRVRDEVELRRAEADATIRVVEAVGAQLRTIADSPGVQEVLKGFGRAVEKRAQLDLDAQQQAHDRQTRTDALAAEREKRRDYLGAGFLVLGGVLAVCGVWLVASGVVDTRNALAAVSILAALVTGRLVRQK